MKTTEDTYDDTRRILTVRELNEDIKAALEAAFPRTVWVKGEVQRLPIDAARRKHVYFELQETSGGGAANFQIQAQLMDWDRRRFDLGRYLDGRDEDIQLANKLEVCLECRVDFYAPYGKIGLRVVGVDKTYSLGRLEARRREVMAHLKAANLLRLNAGTELPELPLRVGLITSPGSAAEKDFLTGLSASPWAFEVRLQGARMQGEQLQNQVMQGLRLLGAAGVDVIVITRGGGSRADLSWFDQQDLAEAIARCPVPVLTAIGHEIDRSIADEVAHTSCKTPTAAAEHLVAMVDAVAGRLETARAGLAQALAETLAAARRRADLADRLARSVETARLRARQTLHQAATRLQGRVIGRVAAARDRLGRLQTGLGARAVTRVTRTHADVRGLAGRLARESRGRLQRDGRQLDHLATQVRLLDPQRLLKRGYTLTLAENGSILKSAKEINPGDRLTTRFQDGQIESIVHPDDADGDPGANRSRRQPQEKGKKRGKTKTDSGQQDLFR